MREAVIVDALRTPIGKYNGSLQHVRPDDLAAIVIRELLKRNPLDPSLVEDVFFGCANQAGEDNRNVARMAVLLSGMPESVPGVTVNRLCASGLEAINQAAAAIHSNIGDIFIAGGTESMSRAPYVMLKPNLSGERGNQTMYDTTLGWRMVNSKLAEQYPPVSLGETAENVAERYGISREEQDEFALSSQLKAQAAIQSGRFKSEIVPVEVKQGKQTVMFDTDEHPRGDTTLEKLAQLKPAFKVNGSVTAGNSSGINDGASALLIMERQTAEGLGLTPIAKIVTWAASGVDPAYMGIGPIPAVTKALKKSEFDGEPAGSDRNQ